MLVLNWKLVAFLEIEVTGYIKQDNWYGYQLAIVPIWNINIDVYAYNIHIYIHEKSLYIYEY